MRATGRRLLATVAFGSMLLLPAPPARADLLDTVLTVLYNAGVIDKVFVEAKPALACLVQSQSIDDQAILACVQKSATEKAEGLLSADTSKLKVLVDVYKAVDGQQWLKVLELAGTDVMKTFVCSLAPGGAVKDFVCSSAFNAVAKLAKPVIKAAITAVDDGDWFKLVTILGPEIACHVEILPGAVRDVVCSPLMSVLNTGKDIAEGLGNALISVGSAIYDVWENEPEKMAPKKYFQVWWVPMYHKGAWLKFLKGDQEFSKLVSQLYGACESHYDSAKPCTPMKDLYTKDITAVVQALKAAPAAYFDVHLKPYLLYYYLYFLQTGGTFAGFSSGDGTPCTITLRGTYPLPQGDEPVSKPYPTVWAYACHQARAQLEATLKQQKPALDQQLATLDQLGCKRVSYAKLSCTRYDGHTACLKAVGPGRESACLLDQAKANQELAAQIAKLLGPKRCKTAGAGSTTVECSRPWKQQRCLALRSEIAGGAATKVQCTLVGQVAFAVLVKQANTIVDALNGVKKVGKAQVPMKTTDGKTVTVTTGISTVPPVATCKTTWDPLAITCEGVYVPPKLDDKLPGTKLGSCPPDPNRDGADSPCYERWPGVTTASLSDKPQAIAAMPDADGGPSPSSSPRELGRPQQRSTRGAIAVPGGREPSAPARLGPSPDPGGLVARAPAGVPATQPPIAVKGVEVEASPFLVVAGARPRVETACRAPMPVLTVAVQVKNTGSVPLPAGKGTTYVKEVGGTTNLSSAGIHLPGVAPGAVAVVSVPVITLSPYSALPGTHQLAVHLNPLTEGGQPSFGKPESPYRFAVTFPVGYCQTQRTPPASSGPAGVRPPGETRGLNPVPEPPSAPTGLAPRSP